MTERCPGALRVKAERKGQMGLDDKEKLELQNLMTMLLEESNVPCKTRRVFG